MSEFWNEIIEVLNTLLVKMPYHGLLVNERYLHHFFSHRVQIAHPKLMDLLDPTTPMRLHPEWPTYKEATGLDFGKYKEINKTYFAVDSGKKGGFIDFALGPYISPEIAVEFKLVYGWQGESIVFDYMKLLDGRNPFRSVVQLTVLLRPNGLAMAGKKDAVHQAMNTAYREAILRLGTGFAKPAIDREHRFIVTELGPNERRHWFHGSSGGNFVEKTGAWMMPA